ncbi:MAG: hypothetical protein AAGA77_22590 [Bacteroidota bacterium]
MNKIFLFAAILLMISCGKDPVTTDEELLGTWVLNNVEGSCLSIPTNATANETGCIDIPTLEVNCSIIEFKGEGVLSYAYNLVVGEGTYEILEDGINICTDRCLSYKIENTRLTLQTGTIELCDPLYTFAKSNETFDNIIAKGQKKIRSIRKNGSLYRDYNYNLDGTLQSLLTYDNSGNLHTQEIYTYTPISVDRTLTFVQSGSVRKYTYYNEAPDRTRRDRLDENGDLVEYRLYFHTPNDCWVDRIETYRDEQLSSFFQYTYAGENCDYEISYFSNGNLQSRTTNINDGMPYFGQSATLDILRYEGIGNITSRTVVKDNEVDNNGSFNAIFAYDEIGFPTSETRSYLDGKVDLYSYLYE